MAEGLLLNILGNGPKALENPTDYDARTTAAIENTRLFFEKMGVNTHLSDYGLDRSVIAAVVTKLKEHSHVKLGKHADITLTDVATILELSL